jgi:uncharacterized membrane protein
MAKSPVTSLPCQICGKKFARTHLIPAELVRQGIVSEILKAHPDWSPAGFICQADLNRFRDAYVKSLITIEKGELSAIERDVVESLVQHETLSVDTEQEWQEQITFGERLADRVADFGGSWKFIVMFFGVMALWIGLNVGLFFAKPFDPYPFILLNLTLSCLAAIQAPIIMMSQNRQEARDRLRARNDYRINLKAELEIRQLHEKLDHLLQRQWERLIEIQEIQIEIMNEMTKRGAGAKKP